MRDPRGSILLALLLLIAFPALALSLDTAKQEGLVGEQANGYLGIVKTPTRQAVRDLVEAVNLRRRDEYEEIAARNGVPLDQVEKLAGKRAIERTPRGQWVQLPNGEWARR